MFGLFLGFTRSLSCAGCHRVTLDSIISEAFNAFDSLDAFEKWSSATSEQALPMTAP